MQQTSIQDATNPVLQLVSDFLTVAFHNILYYRNLYDKTLFFEVQKYKTPVQQCRHPTVCKFIEDSVAACEEQLRDNRLRRVCLTVLSPKEQPLERFVFDFLEFLQFPVSVDGEWDRGAVEEQIQSAVEKISLKSLVLGDLPDGCSYNISFEVREAENRESDRNTYGEDWKEEPVRKGKSSTVPGKCGEKRRPLRSIHFDIKNATLDVWIEESRHKIKGTL